MEPEVSREHLTDGVPQDHQAGDEPADVARDQPGDGEAGLLEKEQPAPNLPSATFGTEHSATVAASSSTAHANPSSISAPGTKPHTPPRPAPLTPPRPAAPVGRPRAALVDLVRHYFEPRPDCEIPEPEDVTLIGVT